MVSTLLPLLLTTSLIGDRSNIDLVGQDFGVGLRPEELLLSRYDVYPFSARQRTILDLLDNLYNPLSNLYRRPGSSGISKIHLDEKSFKVILDVQQFKPEEIEVKIVKNHIVVTAKHEEKQDEHGYISRQFVRRYEIPENVEPDTIVSEISSDGVLTIKAPVKDVPENKNEKKIEIKLTGKPALKPKDEAGEKKKSEEPDSSSATAPTQESATPEK